MVVHECRQTEVQPPVFEGLLEKLEKKEMLHFGVARLWNSVLVTVFLAGKPYAYIEVKGTLPSWQEEENDALGEEILRELRQKQCEYKLYWPA